MIKKWQIYEKNEQTENKINELVKREKIKVNPVEGKVLDKKRFP